MNSFDAYQLYHAIKLHFESDYDFFKYHGKTRVTVKSFENSKHKYQWKNLVKKKNPINYLVANFLERKIDWPGDLFDGLGEELYSRLEKRQQSLSYNFQKEMEFIKEELNLNDILKPKDGQHPILLERYKSQHISLETLIIMNDLLDFFRYWDKKIEEPYIWSSIHRKADKYKPFFTYDKSKFKKILLDIFLDLM